jgi:phosphoribosyl 1,2-cyclic phosphodiesterase
MHVKFWGVRGSTPTPERRNSRYGGNTPCLEVRLANGTLIIFDCGSGLRALGKSLEREYGDRPIRGYVFLTHFHWDHIQGIPFFQPLYRKGNTFLFHSVKRKTTDLKRAIEGQMVNPYFPVNVSAMKAARHYFELDHRPFGLNGAIVSSAPLNHPQDCVAYRVEADGSTFVFATHTEPGSAAHDRAIRDLSREADLLVYDAQFAPEQLQGDKKGWGHSSWLEGVHVARESGAKHLILFHHDPDHDDAIVDRFVEKAREEFSQATGAAEGLGVRLPEVVVEGVQLMHPVERRQERRYRLQIPVRLGWTGAGGEIQKAPGMARDVSRSGIYFVTPAKLTANQPAELEIILPDEITHRGEVVLRFAVRPLRLEQLNETAGFDAPVVGVAARVQLPEEEPHRKAGRVLIQRN